MLVRAGLVILGLVHLANGLWMLAAPGAWYAAIPGVAMTGPFNHHFIEDIGLIFIASGTGLLLGARPSHSAAIIAMAGATWPALHALLHLCEWIRHGLPASPAELASTGIGVIVVGAAGAAFAWLRVKQIGVA